MDNYSSYFSEIEQRFQQRRGSILMLSTLDWALIETWREAGVPLGAVLQGIDNAFDKYEQRAARAYAGKARLRKVNGLAWAAQSVMLAAEAATEAATGVNKESAASAESGLENDTISLWLRGNAERLSQSRMEPALAIAVRLQELASALETGNGPTLEELERTLTVLEEKLHTALLACTPELELVALREQLSRELAPHRSRMQVVQIRQVEQQFLQKRLLESHGLPRLSIFYMNLA